MQGVGKGYVLQWLEEEGLFPLSSYVLVDPDMFRERLPESEEYKRRNPQTAGNYIISVNQISCKVFITFFLFFIMFVRQFHAERGWLYF